MKIKFAGVGSAFTDERYYQSNILIQKNDKNLLVDCGTHAQFSLKEAIGVNNMNIAEKIDALYISHAHADHIGGMEWLGFCSYFNPNSPKKIDLYGNSDMMKDLWDKSLSGGMETIDGEVAHLTTFFKCHSIPINDSFIWQDITFTPVQTVHIVSGFGFKPSYGLMIQEKDSKQKVFITTDTQYAPSQLVNFYKSANYIFQDCSTAPFKDGVHAHYTELIQLDEKIKKKMFLYHYQPDPKQDAKEDGFRGFVEKGQTFDIK